MERIKAEYLQKILDQVNLQNVDYFENLACEYTLQLQMLESGQTCDIRRYNEAQLLKNAETDQEREDSLAYLRFMSKPEIIRMHLEILFKSI
jgi:hypothetical protein